jgi:hypothetical protein
MTSYEGKAGFFIDSILSDRHLLMYSNTYYVVVRILNQQQNPYFATKFAQGGLINAQWHDCHPNECLT